MILGVYQKSTLGSLRIACVLIVYILYHQNLGFRDTFCSNVDVAFWIVLVMGAHTLGKVFVCTIH